MSNDELNKVELPALEELKSLGGLYNLMNKKRIVVKLKQK
jgi:hypothetical protein